MCALLATDWSREQHYIWKKGRGLVCNMCTWKQVMATMSYHENWVQRRLDYSKTEEQRETWINDTDTDSQPGEILQASSGHTA